MPHRSTWRSYAQPASHLTSALTSLLHAEWYEEAAALTSNPNGWERTRFLTDAQACRDAAAWSYRLHAKSAVRHTDDR